MVRVIERGLSEPDWIVDGLLRPTSYLKLIDMGFEGTKINNLYSIE